MHKDYHHLDLFIYGYYGYVHFWLFVCLDQPVVQNAHQETDENNVPTSSDPGSFKTSEQPDENTPTIVDPDSQTSENQADKNEEASIDPSSFTDTSGTPQVFDSPPTAADEEASPPASITNKMSKETGATVNVNDYLWTRDRKMKIRNTTGEQL